MTLKPLDTTVFHASLLAAAILFAGMALSGPVFQPVFDNPSIQDLLRTTIVPLFIGG